MFKTIFTVFAFSLLVTACITESENNKNIFGYSYHITNPPEIVNDTLFVKVGYSGCSGGHTFELRKSDLNSNQLDLWLHKKTKNEMCEAYFEETLSFILLDTQSARKIKMLSPDDRIFTLKN